MTEAQPILEAARYIAYGVVGIVWSWAVYQIVLFVHSKPR